MDYLVTNWQEIVSLVIVGITAFLLIRSEIMQRKKDKCSACGIAELQQKQKYRFNNK